MALDQWIVRRRPRACASGPRRAPRADRCQLSATPRPPGPQRRARIRATCESISHNMTVLLTPDGLRDVLEPVRLVAYEALEYGVFKRDEFIAREGIDDPWYSAHTVRLFARLSFARAVTDGCGWSIDTRVANSGVHLRTLTETGSASVRLMKGHLAKVPHPGHSRSRQEFWNAEGQGYFAFGNEMTVEASNVLLLWNDRDGEVSLGAAVPAGSWDYQSTPKLAVSCALIPREPEGEFIPEDDEGETLITFDQVDLEIERGEAG